MADDVSRPGPTTREPDGAGVHGHVSAPVVAALDGSSADAAVVAWAADEAARTGRRLRLVHVVEPGFQLTSAEAALGELPAFSAGLRQGGRDLVAAAARDVASRRPGLAVDEVVEWGSPSAVLVDLSRGAAWLVVGAPVRTGVERILLGSVALAVVAHSHCAVAVVPTGYEGGAPRCVVVGVDGSPCSAHAVELALSVADAAGGDVTCVVGWSVEVVDGIVVTEPGTPAWRQVEDRYDAVVHEVVDRFARAHPDVAVDVVVRPGGAVAAVLDTATERHADLVVVGSRGRGGFAGLLLGSVSRRVVERAATVVAVAH
jgi:nucleotide-binding universal stress UspA family protein